MSTAQTRNSLVLETTPRIGSAVSMDRKSTSSGSLKSNSSANHDELKKSLKNLGDNCPTCSKKVYFAEQILGPGSIKYHKACFRCTVCKKTLNSSNLTEKESVLYCKNDYAKLYGPHGNFAGATLA